MVFSNAENKRGGANETTRSPLLGARIWPDGRATSSSACLRAHCFAKVMAPASPPKGVHVRAGGRARISYGPKVVRGCGQIMLKIVFFSISFQWS
jgi:hypothetical protein